MLEYTDIGANLSGPSFARDRHAVLERAMAAGVRRILVTASDTTESEQALSLARSYPDFLRATTGVHPHQAAKIQPDWQERLRLLFPDPLVCAVGETGLDFNRNYSPPDAQRTVFEAQLQMAAECCLPVFLHERDAGPALREILTPRRDRLTGGVLHCFTGSRADLFAYLDLDLYIGVTGWICDPRRGRELQSLVSMIPDDRLLIETDAPYLLPRDLPSPPRSKRNEPAFLCHVATALAQYRKQSLVHIATITHANAGRLFGLEIHA